MSPSPRDGGLRPIFRKYLPDLFWVTVETWAVSGAGVPDSWYIAPGGASGWVEYKKHPKRVTPEQSAFLSRVARCGGRAHVAMLVGDELRLYPGASAPALARGGVAASVAWVPGGRGEPRRWDWATVREALVG